MAKTLGDITQELNEKVLAPAKTEAAEILAQARKEAETILAEAHEKAEKTKNDATHAAEALRRQLEVDLDTAARNFILMVQERLEAAIVEPVVEKEIRTLLDDAAFLKRIMEIILTEFCKSQGRKQTLEVLLPEKKRAELEAWFIGKFREKAAGHLIVQLTDKISFGFQIGLEGEGASFNFSTGLVEAFSSFCSPRFRKHFFAREGSPGA